MINKVSPLRAREQHNLKTKAADSQCSSHVFFLLLFSKVADLLQKWQKRKTKKFWAIETKKKNDCDPKCIFLCLRSFDAREGEKGNFLIFLRPHILSKARAYSILNAHFPLSHSVLV